MASEEEEKTFNLKWIVEDCSESNFKWPMWYPGIASDPFCVDAFGCTLWQIRVWPLTDDGYLSCRIERYCNVEEHVDISIESSVTVLGKNGLRLHKAQSLISNLRPKQHADIDIVPIEQLLVHHFANNQLVMFYEIRQIARQSPVDIGSYLWHDEVKVLSDDMKRLFESGYQSDVILKSSDGRLIPVHLCVIIARWKKLQDAMKERPKRPRVVVCPNVNGQILAAFLSYLYTGTIPASDVTIDLFEFVVEQFSNDRIWFYTFPQEMSLRTHVVKGCVVFKWWYAANSAPFQRVLPQSPVNDEGEILVDISTVGSYLDVRFSLSSVFECVHLHCLATLVHPKGELRKLADHFFDDEFDLWHFPDFIPMSLLTAGTEGMHVVFELSFSTVYSWTFTESSTTEFQTGSRAANNVEMPASGLDHFFLQNDFLDMYDVELRTADGFFRGCKSLLGIRSEVLRELFRDQPKRSYVRLKLEHTGSEALSYVVQYLHTGWTKLWSIGQVFKIYRLAVRASLRGLARKCVQFMHV